MKLTYRRFGDVKYTEVECFNFNYQKVFVLKEGKEKLSLEWLDANKTEHKVMDVCEVFVEEYGDI